MERELKGNSSNVNHFTFSKGFLSYAIRVPREVDHSR